MNTIEKDGIMNRFNGVCIFQTRLYARKYYVKSIKKVLERHGCTIPGKNQNYIIEIIQPDNIK